MQLCNYVYIVIDYFKGNDIECEITKSVSIKSQNAQFPFNWYCLEALVEDGTKIGTSLQLHVLGAQVRVLGLPRCELTS